MEWIESLREAFEVAKDNCGQHSQSYRENDIEGEMFFDVDVWTRQPAIHEFVMRSPAAGIVAKLMGSQTARLFYDQIFIREPGRVAPTPWHQDLPYWRVDGEQICTLRLPLDSVPRSTGVEYVKGSQRLKTLYSPTTFSADQTDYDGGLPPVPDIENNRDDYELLDRDVEPGDCLVFQAMVVRGARGGENSKSRRRAPATRWCGEDGRYLERKNETNIPTSDRDPGLVSGDPIGGPMFSLAWPRSGQGR